MKDLAPSKSIILAACLIKTSEYKKDYEMMAHMYAFDKFVELSHLGSVYGKNKTEVKKNLMLFIKDNKPKGLLL